MLGRPNTDSLTVVRFRAHSWIVWIVAIWITIGLFSAGLKAFQSNSSEAHWLVLTFLLGLGLLIPVALLVWDHQRGVHVREDGIRSVGANGSRFLAWSDIAGFEIDAYIAGTIAVVAVRRDGVRVALSDTARWPYRRKAVEQMRDRLAGYWERWTASTDRPTRPDETG
jgi:hypothetical protein